MSSQTPLPLAPDEHRLPKGGTMKKADVFGWTVIDQPGRFEHLDKMLVRIDHDYQREHLHTARILRIASKFSWVKFGVLLVFRRPDGSLWCADGQHRLLAAQKLSAVTTVPCLVFDATEKVQEAAGFLGVNGDRGAVRTIDKFNALLAAQDETALLCATLISQTGYKIARGSGANTVQCISAIYKAVATDLASAEVAWRLCTQICGTDRPNERVFAGLYTLEHEMRKTGAGSLSEQRNAKSLTKAGQAGLMDSIHRAAIFRQATGWRVYAEGVANAINKKGRRGAAVPSMAPVPEAADDE